ncbi:MAG: efflux RND transporter periplasmic adaptor subunit [Candidatus Scalindua sp.]|nr:efflux RND transporter periplasmic adaptor subunit [Candidatus Scalindua sp.]
MKRHFILVSLIALLFHAGCETEHREHKKEDVKFLVTCPTRKDTSITRDYVCQIHAIQHIEIRALEGGYLEKTFVDEGQLVEKGQLIFQIMPVIYQAEFEKAQAEAEGAKIEYLNTKSLADNNVVSPNELAMSKARFDKAKAEMDLAQAHLRFAEIRAPFDGLMGRFQVRLGSLLEEGELLTTLSDNSEMWVYFNVPEAEYLDYKTRKKNDSPVEVKLQMANNQLFEHPGVVTAIEADFNNETGNIAFRATFPNPEGLLRHGETGNILMTKALKNALLIPQKVTFEIMDKKYVFVIDENNVVRPRQITIGEEMTHIYVIKEGLTESDKILLQGLRKVRDKDVITYEFQEPDSVMAHLELYAE